MTVSTVDYESNGIDVTDDVLLVIIINEKAVEQ